MKRRELIEGALLGGALAGPGLRSFGQTSPRRPGQAEFTRKGKIVLERAAAGKPHAGKVLAAIQPHSDDVALFAGGTVAKLINEGYTGYLIRTTNDEMTGTGSRGEGVLHNEQDNDAVATALGLKKAYNLDYRNHRLDAVSPQDFRGRLILLIRLLRIDTVISYDPWGLYEENPDHYATAKVVESACWMAGMDKDYPEQLEAGLKPHGVKEKYYFARGPQIANRVVDIGATVDRKVKALRVLVTQGPAGENGARLRAWLAARHLRLPILGNDDETANLQYIKHFVLDIDSMAQRAVPSDKEVGAPTASSGPSASIILARMNRGSRAILPRTPWRWKHDSAQISFDARRGCFDCDRRSFATRHVSGAFPNAGPENQSLFLLSCYNQLRRKYDDIVRPIAIREPDPWTSILAVPSQLGEVRNIRFDFALHLLRIFKRSVRRTEIIVGPAN